MSVTLLRQDYSSQLSVRNELTGRPSQNRSPSAQSLKAYLTATGFFTESLFTYILLRSIHALRDGTRGLRLPLQTGRSSVRCVRISTCWRG